MLSFEYKNAYPVSSLGYHTNNKYPIFPPLMKDGRSVISSWNAESSINDKIRKENGIVTNWDYRRYLTKNAATVMENNYNETANDTGSMFIEQTRQTPNSPFLYGSINEKAIPYGFEESDLKDNYLSREQLYSRKCAPTLKEGDLQIK